jgi:hypothetical protein
VTPSYSLTLPGVGMVCCYGGTMPALHIFAFGYGLGAGLWLRPEGWLAEGQGQHHCGVFRWLLVWPLLLVVCTTGGDCV